ncbi:MAG: peptidoglycan-binding protein [Parcubacteria group bacterium]|nr:peptidoglycan-binding protein [Parcubacteria group bacterium]
MAKYFYATIIVFLFGLVLLAPATTLAAYNTVTFDTLTTTSVWGTGIDLAVSSGSEVAGFEVLSSTMTVDLMAGSSITITDTNRGTLTNTENAAMTCTSEYSSITVTGNITETMTVTPSTALCDSVVQSVAGSSGGSYTPPPTVTPEPEATPEPETTEALPTVTASAEAVAITVAGGGTAEATTDQGTRAKLELPADAVTADAEVTITPTVQTVVSVATQVAAVPTTQSVVGGYVYDYSLAVAGEAVSTFEESATMSFTYTELQISGLNEDTLTIAYYDDTTSAWVDLVTTVDAVNNKVTATVEHLTLFALLGEQAPEPEVTPEVEAPVVTPITEMTIAELKAEIAKIVILIAELQQELLKIIAAEGGQQLTQNLMLGDSGDAVTLLQTWLSLDSVVYPEAIVSGWFGPLTKAAVIKFQDKYYDEVLAPWNFSKGTGYVGSTTRAQLNALYGGQ